MGAYRTTKWKIPPPKQSNVRSRCKTCGQPFDGYGNRCPRCEAFARTQAREAGEVRR